MSIKIKTSWADNNVIIEGVRIYKSSANFDVNSRPAALVEILDGSEFYEDFDVIDGQTYFYMLSCFLGEKEAFTECFKVSTLDVALGMWIANAICFNSQTLSNLNPLATSNNEWIENFANTKDSGAFNYFYIQNAYGSFSSDPLTKTINLNPLGLVFDVQGGVNWFTGFKNDTKIYFEKADGTVLAYINLTSGYGWSTPTPLSQVVFVGNNDSATIQVANVGSYSQINGTLKVKLDGVEFTPTAGLTNYVGAFLISADMSEVSQVRVKDMSAHIEYGSAIQSGASAFFYMKCIGRI